MFYAESAIFQHYTKCSLTAIKLVYHFHAPGRVQDCDGTSTFLLHVRLRMDDGGGIGAVFLLHSTNQRLWGHAHDLRSDWLGPSSHYRVDISWQQLSRLWRGRI